MSRRNALPLISRLFERAPSVGGSLPEIDGLRGLAAGLVLIGHLHRSGIGLSMGVNLTGQAFAGVRLFFVLSSFLLTLQVLQRQPGEVLDWRRWANYFQRRFFRIYPLYAIVLALGTTHAFLSYALFGSGEVSIAAHFVFLQGAKLFWTVAVEVRFYALLPLLMILYGKLGRSRPWLYVAIVCLLSAAKEFMLPSHFDPEVRTALEPFLTIFMVGHLAAIVYVQLDKAVGTVRLRWLFNVVAGLAAAALIFRFRRFYRDFFGLPTLVVFARPGDPLDALIWAVLLVCMLIGRGLVARVFRAQPLRFFGIISYSVYLWHLTVIEFLRKRYDAPDWVTTCGIVLVVVAVSTVSYVLIERPFMELSSALSRRMHRSGDSRGDSAGRVEAAS